MKRVILSLFFSLPLFAQSFSYLGIVHGQAGAFSGIDKDSTYITGSGSTVNTSITAETLLVDQSFTYMGYNAKGIQRRVYYNGNPAPIFEDTVYEVGDTMHRLMVIGKTSPSTYTKADVKALVTPFAVGNSWTLGILGSTFVADIDGDTNWSTPDTLIITKDSMYVLSMGSITVPAGTFDSVYTIKLRLEGRLWSSAVYGATGSSSAAWSDSLYRDYYIYWKPGLGYVKDSMFQFAKWRYLFVTIRSFNWTKSELLGYWTSVSEESSQRYSTTLSKDGYVELGRYGRIYDISGRLLYKGPGKYRLGKGYYFVVDNGRVSKVIVWK